MTTDDRRARPNRQRLDDRGWRRGRARERDYLTQLDAAIGDGDHGINMTRGFAAVGKALAGQDGDLPPGRAADPCRQDARLDRRRRERAAVGLGAARARAARSATRECFDGAGARRRPRRRAGRGRRPRRRRAGRQDDGRRARARRPRRCASGWTRARRSPRRSRAAAAAAEEGARATVPMQARKGRASYLGERSIGHQDPGATSAALIVRALAARRRRRG